MIVIATVAAGGCLLVTRFPVSAQQPVTLLRVLAGGAAAIAIGLFAGGPRLPRAGLHCAMLAFVAGATILTASAHTSAGFMMAARSLQWLAVYAALFLTPREARFHATAITAGCVFAAVHARLPGTRAEAVIICTTVWVATLLLSALSERLREQADSDHLTGLLNRNGFAKAANRDHALAGRTGAPLTVAVLDLDGFKHVNDQYGHAAGDRMLAELAAAWTGALRPGDVLARFGGDEFVVMFPATTAPGAEQALERLRAANAASWSVGMVEWRRRETLSECLARADRRLYEAKARRRAAAVEAVSVLRARDLREPLERLPQQP